MAKEGGSSFWSDSAVRAAVVSGLFVIIGGIMVALFEDQLDDDPAPTPAATATLIAAAITSPTPVPEFTPTPPPTPDPTPPPAPTATPTPTPEPAQPTPTEATLTEPNPTEESTGNGSFRWDAETGFADWDANRTWDIADNHIVRNDDIEQTYYLSPASLDDARSFGVFVAFEDVPPAPQTGLMALGVVLGDASNGTAFWIGLSVAPNWYESQFVVWYFDGANFIYWLGQPFLTTFAGGDIRFEITVNGDYLYLAVNGQGALGGTLVSGFAADLAGVYASTEGIKVTQFIVSPAGF